MSSTAELAGRTVMPRLMGRPALATSALALTVVLVLLRPHPRGVPAWLAVYGPDLLLASGILLLGWTMRHQVRLTWRDFTAWYALFAVAHLALLLSWLDPALLLEAAKLHYYLLFLLWLRILVDLCPLAAAGWWRCLYWPFMGIAAVTLVQYFAVPWLELPVLALWGDDKLRSFIASPLNARVYATFYNANWFGWAAGLFALTFLQVALRGPRSWRRAAGWLVLVAVLLIVTSGSRSALLALLAGVLTALLLNAGRQAAFRALLVGVALAGVLALGLSQLESEAGIARFAGLVEDLVLYSEAGELGAAGSRVELWQAGIAGIERAPFGGGHPGDGLLAHNSFITGALYFGLPVFLLLVVALLLGLRFALAGSGGLATAMPQLVQWLVMAMTGEFLFATQVMLALALVCVIQGRLLSDPLVLPLGTPQRMLLVRQPAEAGSAA